MAVNNKPVYPTEFFNIPHPTSPVVSIQFRTKINKGVSIDDPSLWEEITFDPNNFFNEITVEDNSGYPSLDLSLTDKNYSYLENIIVKTMVAQRTSNKLVENPEPSKDSTQYFEFFIDKKKTANVRVRIGYSEWDIDEYVSDTDFEGEEYKSRNNNKKPVIRSPWVYFMITGLDMNVTENGLQVSLKGRDPTGSFLDRATMIEKFAKLSGTPKNILDRIYDQIKEASKNASDDGNNKIEFQYIDEPMMYKNRDGGQEIEIMLGGKHLIEELEDGSIRERTSYKKIKQVLREVCSKVSPIMYAENGRKLPAPTDGSKEGEEIDEKSEEMKESYPYTFSLVRQKDKDIVQFYYKDPRKELEQQPNIRTYAWGEHGLSIVQNVDINASQIFSYLNLPLITSGEDGDKGFYVSKAKEVDEDSKESEMDISLGGISNVSDALNSSEFEFTFASGGSNTSEFETNSESVTSEMAAKRMMRTFTAQMNEVLTQGTITLQGDPFYFFDDKVKPFSYIINLVIKRPNYVDRNGEYIEGGRSYLSGLYRVKKATHSVSAGSYTTQLEVIKTPF